MGKLLMVMAAEVLSEELAVLETALVLLAADQQLVRTSETEAAEALLKQV
jgi:hypothetical protein